jgi:DNA-binding response OmpR family regulator
LGSNYHIAVVESDDDLRELVVQILGEAGNEVAGVRSADALAPSWRGDVIVTDTLDTPYEGGQAAAYVRSLREHWRAAIVVMTAHAEAFKDGSAMGADAMLAKPFDLDEFLDVVERAARRQRVTPD